MTRVGAGAVTTCSRQLGQAYLLQSSLVNRATPILKKLAEATGETVSLAVLQGGQVQYPVSIESKRPVKVSPRVAVSFAAKMNVSGRLLTAHLSDALLTELLAGNTPQDAAIRSQLTELRTSGQIIDRGAVEADVVTISRVVRGLSGDAIAAVELLAPQYRAKTELLLPAIDEATKALTTAIGGMVKKGLAAAVEKEVSVASPAPQQVANSGAATHGAK